MGRLSVRKPLRNSGAVFIPPLNFEEVHAYFVDLHMSTIENK